MKDSMPNGGKTAHMAFTRRVSASRRGAFRPATGWTAPVKGPGIPGSAPETRNDHARR